jgi:hypothetical protein
MVRQSKEGGTAEGLPTRPEPHGARIISLQYLAGAKVRTDGEEP